MTKEERKVYMKEYNLNNSKNSINKQLKKKKDALRYLNNKENLKLNTQAWRNKNGEKDKQTKKEWYLNNKEKSNKTSKEWRKNNKKRCVYHTSKRRSDLAQRTPKWVNLKEIKHFYDKCPDGYHVDHIIPLNGKNVCGLHVLNNLQYLPALENLKKHNYF